MEVINLVFRVNSVSPQSLRRAVITQLQSSLVLKGSDVGRVCVSGPKDQLHCHKACLCESFVCVSVSGALTCHRSCLDCFTLFFFFYFKGHLNRLGSFCVCVFHNENTCSVSGVTRIGHIIPLLNPGFEKKRKMLKCTKT